MAKLRETSIQKQLTVYPLTSSELFSGTTNDNNKNITLINNNGILEINKSTVINGSITANSITGNDFSINKLSVNESIIFPYSSEDNSKYDSSLGFSEKETRGQVNLESGITIDDLNLTNNTYRLRITFTINGTNGNSYIYDVGRSHNETDSVTIDSSEFTNTNEIVKHFDIGSFTLDNGQSPANYDSTTFTNVYILYKVQKINNSSVQLRVTDIGGNTGRNGYTVCLQSSEVTVDMSFEMKNISLDTHSSSDTISIGNKNIDIGSNNLIAIGKQIHSFNNKGSIFIGNNIGVLSADYSNGNLSSNIIIGNSNIFNRKYNSETGNHIYNGSKFEGNTIIGNYNGNTSVSGANTCNIYDNVIIGKNNSVSTDSITSGSIVIGVNGKIIGTKSVAIGYGAKASDGGTNINAGTPSSDLLDKIVLGRGGIAKLWLGESGTIQTTSDYRDKTDFQNITKALEFINKLEPITYVYNFRDDYKDEEGIFDEEAYLAGTKKKTRRQSGFKAQDVYAKMIETYNDDNYAEIVDYSKYNYPDSESDKYWMAQSALIPFLVSAIQEQQAQIEELKQQINELKNN